MLSFQLPYHDPICFVRNLPQNFEFLLFGGNGNTETLLVLNFKQSNLDALSLISWTGIDSDLSKTKRKTPQRSFGQFPQWFGLLSFNDFATRHPRSFTSRIFKISQCLVYHHTDKTLTYFEDQDSTLSQPRFTVDNIVEHAKKAVKSVTPPLTRTRRRKYFKQVKALSDSTPARYLQLVKKVKSDIRAGKYYQLNLLRYFSLQKNPSHQNWCDLFSNASGPYASWIKLDDLQIISMSPERFIEIKVRRRNRGSSAHLFTYPIKGTISRGTNKKSDKQKQQTLLNSQKNLAELHMIIDLMRNDFYPVCQPHSIKVNAAHALKVFKGIHHLEGEIEGILRPGTTMQQIINALCPGGSITGAPKQEVIKHIAKYESQRRGFFMGHVFYLNSGGDLYSSILIRTFIKEKKQAFKFAAGSGITLASDPEEERLEVIDKCKSVGVVPLERGEEAFGDR